MHFQRHIWLCETKHQKLFHMSVLKCIVYVGETKVARMFHIVGEEQWKTLFTY